MQFDPNALLFEFENTLPQTDEEQQFFWYIYTRKDEVSIQLVVSRYEGTASVIIKHLQPSTSVSIGHTNCLWVRVLGDPGDGHIEIVSLVGSITLRTFLALNAENILASEMLNQQDKSLPSY